MNLRSLTLALLASFSIILSGCSHNDDKPVVAVAEVHPTKGNNVHGTVTFTQAADKVVIVAVITGLKPDSKHGFHIHEGSECGEDGMKAGGHYNPDKHDHALPDKVHRHAGDLGNLSADKDGKATFRMTITNVTINGDKNPIVNRTVIIHANPDDGSQPTGNAGARIGCGVIRLK